MEVRARLPAAIWYNPHYVASVSGSHDSCGKAGCHGQALAVAWDSKGAYSGSFESNPNLAETWAGQSSSGIVHNFASRRDSCAMGSVLVVKIRFRFTTRNDVFRVMQF